MSASKKTIFGITFFCLLLTSVVFGANTAGWLDEKVTIRFQDKTMSEVLGEISQQTGIAILYDEKLAGEEVTGHYKNIKFSEAINRLFSERNKSIQVLKNEKKIIVKTFGAKQFVLASTSETVADEPSEKEKTMTAAELEKIHMQQYKEYKESIADKNQILEGGITQGELQELHKKQYAEYKKNILNDSEIFDETGMTRGEIKALHKEQYKKYKKNLSDDNEIIDETGMTRGEIKALHKEQYKKYKKNLSDDNEIIDETAMTRGEIKALHEKQLEQDIIIKAN